MASSMRYEMIITAMQNIFWFQYGMFETEVESDVRGC